MNNPPLHSEPKKREPRSRRAYPTTPFPQSYESNGGGHVMVASTTGRARLRRSLVPTEPALTLFFSMKSLPAAGRPRCAGGAS
jgi:hypothetical protein